MLNDNAIADFKANLRGRIREAKLSRIDLVPVNPPFLLARDKRNAQRWHSYEGVTNFIFEMIFDRVESGR